MVVQRTPLEQVYRMPVEQINGNWQMQMFCGIQLLPQEPIKDKDIVGRWRGYLGQ